MKRIVGLLVVSVSLVASALTFAQVPTPLAPAPKGFDKRREGVERGQVETHEYESKSLKATRRLVVYTPPGYSKDTKYPVF